MLQISESQGDGKPAPQAFNPESSELDRFIWFVRASGKDEGEFDYVPVAVFDFWTKEPITHDEAICVEVASAESWQTRPELRNRWLTGMKSIVDDPIAACVDAENWWNRR